MTATALRAFEWHMLAYKRTWRGTLVSSFLNPLLYLAALGIGLGAFIDSGGEAEAALGGMTYLQFIAPGLLAATAMQIGAFESTYPVMGAWKWHKTYYAMTSTPLRPVDLLSGHVMFVVFRLLTTCAAYIIVVAAFGAIRSPWGGLAVLAGVLTGLALAMPTTALSIWTDRDTIFSLYFRFVMIPMFLFSGAFFPIDQLPDPIEPVAYALPVWHGVELSRDFSQGIFDWPMIGLHVGYLALWIVVGYVLAARNFAKRLVS